MPDVENCAIAFAKSYYGSSTNPAFTFRQRSSYFPHRVAFKFRHERQLGIDLRPKDGIPDTFGYLNGRFLVWHHTASLSLGFSIALNFWLDARLKVNKCIFLHKGIQS